MKGVISYFVCLLTIFSVIPVNYAANDYSEKFVVINSGDWRDVYTGILYAGLMGYDSRFMMSEKHSSWIPNFIDISQEVVLIESGSIPYVINYRQVLQSDGYAVDEYKSEDFTAANLYFAQKLAEEKNIKKFIITDDSYGYNAISVAPYAYLTKSFVLFADEGNIKQVNEFLKGIEVQSLLFYGELDEEVIEELKGYNHDIISQGNRFANNIEIVKRYTQMSGAEQVLITNGQFIESELISGGMGTEPVIFIGQDEPPDQVVEFLKTSSFKTGILVGNEYFSTARKIKERTGLNIFVKFAQSSATGGEFQKVEGLDRFYLPSIELNLTIVDISYNTKTNQLEIIYKNNGNVKIYVKSDIGINADKIRIRALGDKEAFTIDEGETKGRGYTADLSEQIMLNQELEASYFVRYGESEGSLERALEGKFPISIISKEDICDVKINKVSYDKGIQRFFIEVQNLANATCYVKPGLRNVMVSDEEIDLEYPRIGRLEANETQEFRIKQRLDEVDIEDNRIVTANVVYGSREEFLVRMYEQDFDLIVIESRFTDKIIKFIKGAWIYIAVIVIIAGLSIYLIKKRKSSKNARKKRTM